MTLSRGGGITHLNPPFILTGRYATFTFFEGLLSALPPTPFSSFGTVRFRGSRRGGTRGGLMAAVGVVAVGVVAVGVVAAATTVVVLEVVEAPEIRQGAVGTRQPGGANIQRFSVVIQ